MKAPRASSVEGAWAREQQRWDSRTLTEPMSGELPAEMRDALTLHVEALALVEQIQQAPATAAPGEREAGNQRIEEPGVPGARETARDAEHSAG